METSSNTDPPDAPASPKRGEIWRVNFDPTVGSEIRKVRPAVVISSDSMGRLPVKLVAPVTEWKPGFAHNLWHVRVEPDDENGLSKTSAIDALQVRSVSTERFVELLGHVSQELLSDVVAAVAVVIEFE